MEKKKLSLWILVAVLILCYGVYILLSRLAGKASISKTGTKNEVFRVQTGWIINGEFAPICSAIVNGYYEDEHLDVQLIPGGPVGASFVVATNAIAQDPTLDVAVEGDAVPLLRGVTQEKESERLKVKAIASFWTESPYGFIVREDSGITSLKDLGKKKTDGTAYKIGVTADFALKDALASYIGVDKDALNFVTVGFDATPFLSGQVDALAAYWTTQAYDVEKAGIKYKFLSIGEIPNFSQPSMIIEATDTVLANKRAQILKWLKATQRGISFVSQSPQVAAQQIQDPRCGGDKLDAVQEEWLIRKSIPLFTTKPKIGALDTVKLDAFANAFAKIKQIPSVPKSTDYIDSSFSPEL